MTYSLCGFGVRLRCHDGFDHNRLEGLLRDCFVLEPRSDTDAELQLEFRCGKDDDLSVSGDEVVLQSGRLIVQRTAAGFCLRYPNSSRVDIDTVRSRLVGVIGEKFWSHPVGEQRELFLLSLLMLMHRLGRYGLHANGLVRNETGYLVIGSSGSGKTTLSIALVRQGWQYISDDAIALRPTPAGVVALALRRGFSCTAQTTERFVELKGAAWEGRVLSDDKRLANIDGVYLGQFVSQCVPRVLLFPKIADGSCSRVVPLDETTTMLGLMEQSPGIMTRRPEVERQLTTLKCLLQQTPQLSTPTGHGRLRVGGLSCLIEQCGAA